MLLCFSSIAIANVTESDYWTLEYKEMEEEPVIPHEEPQQPQNQNFDPQSNITWYSATFGATITVQAPVGPTVTVNWSSDVEETNATLYGFLVDNQSEDTTCWLQWNKESNTFTSPTANISVGVQPQGTNFSYNATPLENGTLYYFRTQANNS